MPNQCICYALAAILLLVRLPFPASGDTLSKATVAQIERVVLSYRTKAGIPGLSVAVALGGKVVWSNGYGYADIENHVPAKATTVYRTASIGKMITATAAMQLVEQGKLDLDADIRRYCPAFPAKPWPITTRELLGHLSGIRHYGGPHDEEEQFSTKHYKSVVEAMGVFKDDPLQFEPGTNYLYSSYGYVVVGCVIEGASGQSFLGYMHDHIFAPAQMSHTRDDDPAAIIPDRAAGYIKVNGRIQNARKVDMSNRLPAGGYATTVEDLGSFAAALLGGRLVRPATLQQMMIPPRFKNGDTVNYGLGMALSPPDFNPHDEKAVLLHGGSSPGVSGIIYIALAHQCTVVFLTNLENIPDRMETAAAIAKVVLDGQRKPAR